MRAYLKTPYNRRKPVGYSKDFVDRYIQSKTFYLSEKDQQRLSDAGRREALPSGRNLCAPHTRTAAGRSRVGVSRMEGNTYSILETERLIRSARKHGKDRKEAVMILNHKEAISMSSTSRARSRSAAPTTQYHALLADGLLIDPAMAGRLRRMPVNISASSYRPLTTSTRSRKS